MKVLMVSKACYVAVYRKKLEELASLPEVDLTLLVPPYWKTGPQRALLEPGMDSGYRMIVENPVLNGNFHLHFYRRMRHFLQTLQPDLLHIDEEPYDLVTFLTVRTAKKVGVKTVFFTWQNIERQFPVPFRWFEAYVLKHSAGAIAGNKAAAEILQRKGYRQPLTVIPQFGIDPSLYSPAVSSTNTDTGPGTSSPIGCLNRPVFANEGPAKASSPGDPGLEALAGDSLSPIKPRVESGLAFERPSEGASATSGRSDLEKRPFRIGYVGRLVSEKGIMVLLEALAGLRGDWRLSLRGDGPLRSEIEQFCQTRRLSQQIELSSWIPSAQVPPILRELDVLVLPSLTTRGWMEQFGRVLVEAMACEVTVIGSDSGEIPQVIGDSGLIAREGDAADLRRQLQSLLDNPDQRHRLAQKGRERALREFTQERVARETFRFYQEILNKPGML